MQKLSTKLPFVEINGMIDCHLVIFLERVGYYYYSMRYILICAMPYGTYFGKSVRMRYSLRWRTPASKRHECLNFRRREGSWIEMYVLWGSSGNIVGSLLQRFFVPITLFLFKMLLDEIFFPGNILESKARFFDFYRWTSRWWVVYWTSAVEDGQETMVDGQQVDEGVRSCVWEWDEGIHSSQWWVCDIDGVKSLVRAYCISDRVRYNFRLRRGWLWDANAVAY